MGRRAVAEFVGTAFLLAAVVGSGIMGERLAGGSVGLALLANTLATGAALVALILAFAPISGAHFNPTVTVAFALSGDLRWRLVPVYVLAQVAGGFLGVAMAHAMFGFPMFFASKHDRSGAAQLFSEFVATFGLLTVIWCCARWRPAAVAYAVGTYITAAYWFTASTSFANPAVTLARAASDTFAGIRAVDVPGFVAAQFVGAIAATVLCRWLCNLPAGEAAEEEGKDGGTLQRVVSVHRQLGALDHGGGHSQPHGQGSIHGLQCGEPSHRPAARRGAEGD